MFIHPIIYFLWLFLHKSIVYSLHETCILFSAVVWIMFILTSNYERKIINGELQLQVCENKKDLKNYFQNDDKDMYLSI